MKASPNLHYCFKNLDCLSMGNRVDALYTRPAQLSTTKPENDVKMLNLVTLASLY
jgi:hypothetical protein